VSSHTFRARLGDAASVFAMNMRLRRGEVVVVPLLAILGVLFFCGWLFFSGPSRGINWGFGREWDCSDQGRGGALVCVKHPLKMDKSN
jgi:hypothetical protein